MMSAGLDRLFISLSRRSFHPLLDAERLVLERVRQLVRQHRLLLLGVNPIQQIHVFVLTS